MSKATYRTLTIIGAAWMAAGLVQPRFEGLLLLILGALMVVTCVEKGWNDD